MRPLAFVWPYALVFWSVFVWSFTRESLIVRRGVRDERETRSQDRGSLYGVMVAQFASFGLAFFAAFRLHAFDIGARQAAFWLGVALVLAGAQLRRHCFRMLGEYFTGNVQVRSQQPVIQSGAYRWIRHPSYSAGLLMLGGLGLALGNWLSLCATVSFTFVAYLYRVAVEERALVATIGDPYREYMTRTRRFVPFLF